MYFDEKYGINYDKKNKSRIYSFIFIRKIEYTQDSYKNNLVEFQKIFDRNSFQQYKKLRLSKLTKLFDKYPFVQCDDPTFINKKFKNGLKKYTNKIIQRG